MQIEEVISLEIYFGANADHQRVLQDCCNSGAICVQRFSGIDHRLHVRLQGAAILSVLGAMLSNLAALLRLRYGSIPSCAADKRGSYSWSAAKSPARGSNGCHCQ